jgi:hypothetical protein
MLLATVPDQQIVAATAANLSWQPTDSDGEPATPGTVTVGVTRSAGTVVLAPGAATSGSASAPRTVALTAAQTAAVDWLTATWSVSGVVVGETVHEVVGAPLITRAQLIEREPKLTATALTEFLRARREADDLFFDQCRRSFVPRFAVERIQGRWLRDQSRLSLRFPDVSEVRWANHIDSNGTVTAIDVAGVGPSSTGIVTLVGSDLWPCDGEIEVGYVHGMTRPPHDVLSAVARYMRDILGSGTSSIPDRATTYSDGQGGTTQLATPGLGPFVTGIPEVDKVLMDRAWKVPGIA